ncbi:MAG: symmetrical bis(5'-nucleosyl)-tetraphosphatase [Gammaproteobacteria bacterium]|nr:symmetrical bis(5'-nucleosyl)-tetraphosphatase [Gammaproteobacteria bacterium]
MAIYAIGDIQGCYEELARLIDHLRFHPERDELWFVGDLVNRGPRSVDVLRFVRGLGNSATVVLGNHDLHLLAATVHPDRMDDCLRNILMADDAGELLEWLRHRPLIHYRPEMNTLMVHAGLHPTWDPLKAVKLAHEVEAVLRSDDHQEFFKVMYGNEPDNWSDNLQDMERLRMTTNCLTRIRYCYPDGRLEFSEKGPPGSQPAPLLPWFEVPGRANESVRVVAGHWSALGLVQQENLLMLDTGCVWGRELTAVKLDGPGRVYTIQAVD